MQAEVADPVMQQSLLMWYVSALGFKYALLLPVAGLFSLLATLLIVIRGRGPFVAGGLMLAVAAPIFIGLMGTVEGAVSAYRIIAMSSITPKPAEMAEGMSMALATLQVGVFLAIPSFALAALGSLVRSLTASDPSAAHDPTVAYGPPSKKPMPSMK